MASTEPVGLGQVTLEVRGACTKRNSVTNQNNQWEPVTGANSTVMVVYSSVR